MQKPVPSKRHRTIPEIRQFLARFRQSGVSQLHFARNEGVCLSTLRRYLKRFPGSDAGVPPGAVLLRTDALRHDPLLAVVIGKEEPSGT
jgi:hypothetical protein